MPARVEKHWQERVRSLKGEHLDWGAGRIARELQREAERANRTDSPSERWVGNFLRNDWNKMSQEERREYRHFHWPESMEAGLLPWEASRPLLDFFVRRGRPDEIGTERPTNRLARWFWRLYQVAQPEADEHLHNLGPTELDRVEAMARQVAAHETSSGVPEHVLRAVEGWLACHGWTESGEADYYARVGQGQFPDL